MTGDAATTPAATEGSSAPLTLLGAAAAAVCEGDVCDVPTVTAP